MVVLWVHVGLSIVLRGERRTGLSWFLKTGSIVAMTNEPLCQLNNTEETWVLGISLLVLLFVACSHEDDIQRLRDHSVAADSGCFLTCESGLAECSSVLLGLETSIGSLVTTSCADETVHVLRVPVESEEVVFYPRVSAGAAVTVNGSAVSADGGGLLNLTELPVDLVTIVVRDAERTDMTTIQVAVELEPPPWASRGGRDDVGPWAELQVNDERARLRWVPAGTFLMGSPDSELGHVGPEGPRHHVTLSEPYWVAETECTQALWTAVLGSNPSVFKGADRPVEMVSWDDVQVFLGKLGDLVEGLQPRLPTEAEWEYACRAGSETSTYVGDLVIAGVNDAPLLDSIAWYSGNSGVEFELAVGVDSSQWPDKQYPHTKAGSHSVRGKMPNAWGLYDTLGNVAEWVADRFSLYTSAPVSDPVAPESSNNIVFRGGGWREAPTKLRAAQRDGGRTHDKANYIGFRFVQDAN